MEIEAEIFANQITLLVTIGFKYRRQPMDWWVILFFRVFVSWTTFVHKQVSCQ